MLLEKCMLMLICWNCYNLLICHFCHDWCVHPMRLMSTCVLIYAMPSFQGCMPCIFVISVVTSTSMQARDDNVADFRNLVISLSHVLLLFLCHVFMLLQGDLCPFLSMISKGVLNIWMCSTHPCLCWKLWSSLACHFRALLLLQNVSWQIVYMIFNFYKVVVVDPCMLWCCSCHV